MHIRWLPTHCSDHEVVALNEEDYPDADKARKQFNRRFLDMSVWMMAWDRYALGATILGQMAFVDTQNHKAVVEEVQCLCECLCGVARICTLHVCRLLLQRAARAEALCWVSSTMTWRASSGRICP